MYRVGAEFPDKSSRPRERERKHVVPLGRNEGLPYDKKGGNQSKIQYRPSSIASVQPGALPGSILTVL